MNTKFISIITIIVVLISVGCYRSPFCETGFGDIVTEQRYLNEFDRIALNINANVFLSQGEEQFVEIHAQQNIINILKTNVLNDELSIEFSDCVNYTEGVDIYITVKDIESIKVTSSGSIYSDEPIDAYNLDLKIDGSGSIELNDIWTENCLTSEINGSGHVTVECADSIRNQNIIINGSGNLYAFGLPTDNVDIVINASGNVYVNSIETLDVQINGSGSVYYIGYPDLNAEIFGSGEINSSND